MPRPDPFLPAAPAQVKVLVLPVGPMHRDRFAAFLDRFKSEPAVSLRDVSADHRPNRNMFSPLAFPDGVIFYDLGTHIPPDSHLALTPFELYREPLVVLALADGVALKTVDYGSKRHSAIGRSVEERNVRALYQELEELRDTYTKALVHRVLIFDYVADADADGDADTDAPPPLHMPEEGMATVPPVEQSKRTTIKTIMADVSSLLLAEMNTLARSFEAMSYIESPGQAGGPTRSGSTGGDASDDGSGSTLASRRNSQFALPTRSGSMTSAIMAADRAHARMSMPVPFKSGSPFGSSSAGSSTPGRPSTPVGASAADDGVGPSSVVTSPERGGTASSSHIAVQGFGSGGLNERWRHKGKSRVTIVVASLYLQAGLWTDALKELIDGATVARSINDHLWHGKALELIVVCLLLLAWAGIEFQVPTVCLPPPEKGSAAHQAALAQEAAAEKAHPELPKWIRHLQMILPDLLDRILALYARISSAEHLPPLPMAEATLRFSNILTALHTADGTMNRTFLRMVVEGTTDAAATLTTSPRLTVTPSRAYIMNVLFRAFPSSTAIPTTTTDALTTIDRIVILSGIAANLGRLGLQRKKAMVVRELMTVLISGLVEARTRGAAEVGIHPAAGLVSLNGAGATAAAAAAASASASHASHTHGAAALDLAEGDIESGVETFLGMLLKTYGVVELQPSVLPGLEQGEESIDDSDDAIMARIREQATARLFGLPGNKFNLLRACINFCEALPDFAGVLKYSSDLLRTGGSGIAPGATRGDAAAVLSRSEQVRLVTNIAKTSNLSRRLGFGAIAAEYWDEFLVRGVKLEPAPAACQPIAHTKEELPGITAVAAAAASTVIRTSQDVDPFIHNSFLKPSEKALVEQILVVDEPATFRLTLQNPYDIDVEIESIRIETDGAAFEAFADRTVLGPFRTQIVKVSGVPRAAGALRVTGAVVQVRGCRERRFPVFAEPWSPERPEKVKHIGRVPFQPGATTTAEPLSEKRSSTATAEKRSSTATEKRSSAATDKRSSAATDKRTSTATDKRTSAAVAALSPARQLVSGPPLTTSQLALHVIPAQPMVVVESTTLPQSAVMVLEGERRVFSVTLKNLSTQTPVDFLLFSFQDSTQASVQAALSKRDTSPAELYEYELILAKKQALRLRTGGAAGQKRRYIGPGDTATYEFEILGKPGLTSGTIQVDYAHLGVPADEVASTFYTRQAALHLTVTVNASVEIARMDVLPLHGGIPEPLWERCGGTTTATKKRSKLSTDKYCLLLLDLRNAWPSQMRVELTADDGDGDDTEKNKEAIVVTEYILPGNTTRVVVPMRRIYLDDPHAAVPALNPSRQRQFVVSTGKITPDGERANREAFWYRERILDRLRGNWSTTSSSSSSSSSSSPRSGSIELRSIRLTPRMIEAIKVDEVGIDVTMRRAGHAGRSASQKSRVVRVDDFAEMCVRITNRTAAPLYPTLRLMPALCHRPLNVALDYTRKLAWNGALQQTLPLLGARSSTEVRLGVTALCRGEFEVTASVEETRLWTGKADGADGVDGADGPVPQKPGQHGRPRSNTETLLLDSVLGPRERRIWHSRKACHFVVVDGE